MLVDLPVWPALRFLVAGDLMLDTYAVGKVNRQSPEAPVEVLELEHERKSVGGAGNVALNLVGLGHEVRLMSTLGKDVEGATLRQLLFEAGVSVDFLGELPSTPTTHKIRYLDGVRHLLRVDHEKVDSVNPAVDHHLDQQLENALDSVDVLVLQDYEKGFFNPQRIERLIQKGQEKGILVGVDPKREHFWEFRGVDLFKPNLKELEQALGRPIPVDTPQLEEACRETRERLGCRLLLVTLAERGVCWMDHGGFGRLETKRIDVVDVCGAGDSVIAAASAALASGMSPQQIAGWSNLAGGMACLKSGTQPLVLTEILRYRDTLTQ
ncbi:MAG: bifunctional heptose 7-phosphate kinase/heptose 1-phosphate adenyltransferase [Bacteroidia bacterium]